MRYIAFDCEVQMGRHYDFALRPTKLLCISFTLIGSGKMHTVSDQEGYDKFIKFINKPNTVLVAHNATFDVVQLHQLLGAAVTQTVLCTRNMASAIYRDGDRLGKQDMDDKRIPDDLVGSHALGAWALRLDMIKDEEDTTQDLDWSTAEYSEEMRTYCEQDVAILEVLYNHLQDQIKAGHTHSTDAYDRKHTIQSTLGWYSNRDLTKYQYNIGADNKTDFE